MPLSRNKFGTFDLVLDMRDLSMNTTLTSEERRPPLMTEILNGEMSLSGRFKKRSGMDDYSSGTYYGSPTRVNAVAPFFKRGFSSSVGTIVAIFDGDVAFVGSGTGNWADTTGTPPSGMDTVPWNIAWGLDATPDATLYFANVNSGVVRVNSAGAITTLGGAVFDAAHAVEYHLDKLWVGRWKKSGTTHGGSLKWSATADDNTWSGAGTGQLDLSSPGGGDGTSSLGVSGLRVYRQRMYIGAENGMWVLTGTTSDTFGSEYIREFNFINGATMWVLGEFMFFVDRDGIWQFNGLNALNVAQRDMRERWEALSETTDIDVATASYDDAYGIYRVLFPAKQEIWNYHYQSGRWDIWKPHGADAIRVISPPFPTDLADAGPNNFMLGTLTNGKVHRMPNGADDDGATINSSFTTGYINLPELAGAGHAEATITDIWLETVEQSSAATYSLTLTVDGSNRQISGSDSSASDAGGSTDYPVLLRLPVPQNNSGRYFRFKFNENTANVRGDLRKVIVRYSIEDI